MTDKNDVQSQAILANLEAAGADNTGIGPRGTASFTDKPFSTPVKGFAPIFDIERARRHLYKSLLLRMNEELSKGPLAGYVWIIGVRREPSMYNNYEPLTFEYGHGKGTYRVSNRMFAYKTYFTNLHKKYTQEILDAEDKVMERE